MSKILDFLKKLPIERMILVACLAVASLVLIKIVLALLDKVFKRSKLNELTCRILRVTVKAFLLFMAVIVVLGSAGISVSSLIAALSVIGVAFSLAIQGFLSNVFGGIQIVSNHPFNIGDYVEAGGEAGTVREVGLFYTKLDTPDKKLIQIPNSKIANDSIINYSNAKTRRIEFLVSVSYDEDVDKVRGVLLELLSGHPLVLKEEGASPVVHVKEFRDSDVCYTARAWSENKDYWTVYFDIMDAIKPTLEANGVHFSYPHVTVQMLNEKKG